MPGYKHLGPDDVIEANDEQWIPGWLNRKEKLWIEVPDIVVGQKVGTERYVRRFEGERYVDTTRRRTRKRTKGNPKVV